MMFAEPAAPAETRPVVETVATLVSLDDQVTKRPLTTFPFASRAVAVACVVCPVVIELFANVTVTDATGTLVTLSVECPDLPSLVAMMAAKPGPTAVTAPEVDTVATAVLFD